MEDKNIDIISSELFNKIRTRFDGVRLGDEDGKVTIEPKKARFFEFELRFRNERSGAVTINVTRKSLIVVFSGQIVKDKSQVIKDDWYNFLRSLRMFAKRNLLEFDVRDITKDGLEMRDYKFLSKYQDKEMSIYENKMFGTSKSSYQKVGNARIIIRHSRPINPDIVSERSRNIKNIFIENSEGERFKYPYKYLKGARAMATHVSNGGSGYDDFGKYIVEINEELYKLRNFKRYVSSNNEMALQEDISNVATKVYERIDNIKSELNSIANEKLYNRCFENYGLKVKFEVNEDSFNTWINTHPIGKYRGELENVIPYIYKLVNECKSINYDDIKKEKQMSNIKESKSFDHILILESKLNKIL